MDIKIPFLGDGIDAANVVSILIKPGDEVSLDQTLLELETDKATAPVPSTSAGKVASILVNEGDVVKEGMVVVQLDGANGTAPAAPAPAQPVTATPAPAAPVAVAPVVAAPAPTPAANYNIAGDMSSVVTTPSIKQFAMLSGLDLTRISGTGNGGRITWDDVKQYVAYIQATAFAATAEAGATETVKKAPAKPAVDFSKFGPIRKEKITSLRQKISDHLSNAWTEIPHVTQFADINIDGIMALRKELNAKLKKSEVKLSVTVFILKAIAQTLAEYELFNSSLVDNELILKDYIHLGVAVDTPAGLVVPVIRDVNKKSLQAIAKELDALAEKARNKALAVEDIQGATFTLSNLGGLGASHFTPIVNSPEVAILGTGRALTKVTYNDKDKSLTNSLEMPIALSYDHRVIDGADGARFVQSLTTNIESFDKKWVK
ncbi:MAG: 2-oxo acid dehydrogenase subunit E2 [Candidatus Marinamargulisbacteria bacterium]